MNEAITIAGVTPARTLVPADRVELAAIVRDLAAAGKTFAFVGGGTELELGNAPRALDAVVRTTSLDRVVDYSPADMVVEVEAGMPLATLQKILAMNGQRLALDTPHAELASIGTATLQGGARVRDADQGGGARRLGGAPG